MDLVNICCLISFYLKFVKLLQVKYNCKREFQISILIFGQLLKHFYDPEIGPESEFWPFLREKLCFTVFETKAINQLNYLQIIS